jgi:hypothetical protein
MWTLDYNNADAHRLPILNNKKYVISNQHDKLANRTESLNIWAALPIHTEAS